MEPQEPQEMVFHVSLRFTRLYKEITFQTPNMAETKLRSMQRSKNTYHICWTPPKTLTQKTIPGPSCLVSWPKHTLPLDVTIPMHAWRPSLQRPSLSGWRPSSLAFEDPTGPHRLSRSSDQRGGHGRSTTGRGLQARSEAHLGESAVRDGRGTPSAVWTGKNTGIRQGKHLSSACFWGCKRMYTLSLASCKCLLQYRSFFYAITIPPIKASRRWH